MWLIGSHSLVLKSVQLPLRGSHHRTLVGLPGTESETGPPVRGVRGAVLPGRAGEVWEAGQGRGGPSRVWFQGESDLSLILWAALEYSLYLAICPNLEEQELGLLKKLSQSAIGSHRPGGM